MDEHSTNDARTSNETPSLGSTREASTSSGRKRPYSSPRLHSYGSIEDLTQAREAGVTMDATANQS